MSPWSPATSRFLDVLVSWPDLDPSWRESEEFCLMAAALGFESPPPRDPPGPSPLEWEAIAQKILDRDFLLYPADESTIRSWEIGLLGWPSSKLCRSAAGKLEVITPARWRKEDLRANRLLPR